MPTMWLTKYALTTGIERRDDMRIEDGYATNDKLFSSGQYRFMGKNDFHLSEDDALRRADQMRKAKIASLLNQIGKLEKMVFKMEEAS